MPRSAPFRTVRRKRQRRTHKPIKPWSWFLCSPPSDRSPSATKYNRNNRLAVYIGFFAPRPATPDRSQTIQPTPPRQRLRPATNPYFSFLKSVVGDQEPLGDFTDRYAPPYLEMAFVVLGRYLNSQMLTKKALSDPRLMSRRPQLSTTEKRIESCLHLRTLIHSCKRSNGQSCSKPCSPSPLLRSFSHTTAKAPGYGGHNDAKSSARQRRRCDNCRSQKRGRYPDR